ncbi:hypothetical protein JCM8547_000591 [Rhodosporidiobolus lusitaniae]
MVDFRGACVEDLQLSPALVLPVSTSIGTALQLAFERDFSIIPLHSPFSRASLLGWLSVDELKPLVEKGENEGGVDLEKPLSDLQSGSEGEGTGAEGRGAVKQFRRSRRYEVITPSTPLEDLESFFSSEQGKSAGFALVTDSARKFVLGLVTRDDLTKFTTRRFPTPDSPETISVGLPAAASASGRAQPLVA